MQNGPVKFLVVNPEELRLIVHALISVTPTGGGSPLNSCTLKILKQHDVDTDAELLRMMTGQADKEIFEYLEEPVPPRVRELVKFAHPYDIK
jgi:hypothetical protein